MTSSLGEEWRFGPRSTGGSTPDAASHGNPWSASRVDGVSFAKRPSSRLDFFNMDLCQEPTRATHAAKPRGVLNLGLGLHIFWIPQL
jgi:hypothetical protein